ncbi:Ni/Fe hydrogenase subunit alpha [Candidatus Bathyarchaeota archaeon]|nr:MAG: Ni/Fe hydrogenase subunit alpha [Candidatus Bathyarchaeota archaeon]RLG98146.1 MAG: Ni/Fe hydrogenase subunit alpha [Candidatus Bathyarchaeota archaeon]
MREVVINPITRLEGHGKITIFLNDEGNVEEAYLQVPELRGFEKFCEGRRAEDLPIITPRICGVCPVAHHMASAKACDAAFNVEPTETAKKLRELEYCGYIIYDHILHFYFLGGPDFIVGPDAPPAKRNILGVIEKAGIKIGKEVIKHRAYGQRITAIIGGKATHPVSALPGGVSKPLSEEERREIEEMVESCVEFAKFTLELFNDVVLENVDYVNMIRSEPYTLRTYYMGTVDENNKVNFYDGDVRIVDPEGKEFLKFRPSEYLDVIEEHVEPWTYVKLPYLKKVGWRGLVDGPESGVYRVGPLGRLNAADGMATPLAQEEYERMYKTLGGKPVHATLAFHWARLIELMYAAERALELVTDPSITSRDIRNKPGKPGEGVGIVEAARGTLIHHYILDEKALAKKVNLIVATTHNMPGICMSIRDAAKAFIRNGRVEEGLLNRVEMAFRAYDPCFACATHFAIGEMPLEIEIYDSERNLLKKIRR